MELPRRLLSAINHDLRHERTLDVISELARNPKRVFDCDSCKTKGAIVLREINPEHTQLLCADEDEIRFVKNLGCYFFALDMSPNGMWSQYLGDRPALYIVDSKLHIWDDPNPLTY